MMVFPLFWKASLNFLGMGGHFTCMLRPEWVMGGNVMLLYRCEMDVFNEGFIQLLQRFNDFLMSRSLKLWWVFVHETHLGRPLLCYMFEPAMWDKTGKNEDYGKNTHSPHLSCNCEIFMLFNRRIKELPILLVLYNQFKRAVATILNTEVKSQRPQYTH